MTLPIDTALLPMEARLVAELPRGKDWRYEPKWDGFRCLAYKDGDTVILRSKSGKPLERYFPDIVAVLQTIKAPRFAIDGELVIGSATGYEFSDLQLRLHPAASRVQKLAAAQPASYIIFDMLMTAKGEVLLDKPLQTRHQALEDFFTKFCTGNKSLILSPQTATLKTAQGWLIKMAGRVDGLMAKNINDVYVSGERQMQKYKILRTADCVVSGFRYGTGTSEVGSLLLGLYDDAGLLNHVGFTSSIAKKDRPAMTAKLEKLVGGPGFTGKAPGGPSRWSTHRSADWQPLKPALVVEVEFNQISDNRFRHGTKLLRWRPDKKPQQCKMQQIFQPKTNTLPPPSSGRGDKGGGSDAGT